MKIRLLPTLFIILCHSTIIAQNLYYDAIELASLKPVNHDDTLYTFSRPNSVNLKAANILKNYCDDTSYDSICSQFATNPFFNLPPTGILDDASQELVATGSSNSVFSSIGGLNVTNIVYGLAKFLVKRTKQELTIAFFTKFKDDLDRYPELNGLFPNTYRLLKAVDEEIYNFSGYLNSLRETFQKDIAGLIPNLRRELQSGSLKTYLSSNLLLKGILQDGLLIAEELQAGRHPGDVLTSLSQDNISGSNIKNFSPGLKTVNLFSQALRSRQDSRYWISSDSLNLLFKDEVTFKIFLGLIYQQGKSIEFVNKSDSTTTLGHILEGLNTSYNINKPFIKSFLRTLVNSAQSVERNLETIRFKEETDSSNSTYQDHYAFYTSSITFLQSVLEIKSIPILTPYCTWNSVRVNTLFDISSTAGELYLDVNEKRYFGAIVNTVAIIDQVIPQNISTNELKDISKTFKSEIQNNIDTVSLNKSFDKFVNSNPDFSLLKKCEEIEVLFEKLKNDLVNPAHATELVSEIEAKLSELFSEYEITSSNKVFLSKLMKYGNLAAAICEANSSDEVEEIIESIALPAGSARIKRESKNNLCLNAYMGYYAGIENLPTNNNGNNYGFATGISAPVGLAYSIGIKKGQRSGSGGKSLTFFMPLIDVGALAAFRFGDDSTEVASEIKLENIFAPGAYIYFGFGKIPVSLGGGFQYGPRLYEVNSTTTESYKDYYVRWSLTLAVDIPLLNLHTTPR